MLVHVLSFESNNVSTRCGRSNLALLLAKLYTDNCAEELTMPDKLLLDHLKSLPAPAVDIEFRSLCSGEHDEEGTALLSSLLSWCQRSIATGTDFELLQAYLARLLVIYSELFLSRSEVFSGSLRDLLVGHRRTCKKFGELVQSNMCLLKLLSGLPST